MEYKCLQCGVTHGSPADGDSENWYWRMYAHGRVGPFCSIEHSGEFRMTPEREPQFSLAEHTALAALQRRYQEGL